MIHCATCVNLKSERNIDQIRVRHLCVRIVESPITGLMEPLGQQALTERLSTDPRSCGEAAQFYEPRP